MASLDLQFDKAQFLETAERMQFCYEELLENDKQQEIMSNLDLIIAAFEFQLSHVRFWSHQFRPRNPHHDEGRTVWHDYYSGLYQPVDYSEQFDLQWELALDRPDSNYAKESSVRLDNCTLNDMIASTFGRYDYHFCSTEALKEHEILERGISRTNFVTLDLERFQDADALDVGCGFGRWTAMLKSIGAKVTSVDASPNAVMSTRRFNKDTHQMSLFDLPKLEKYADGFDLVVCWGVLHHTHDPYKGFKMVSNALREGGVLFIQVYNDRAKAGFHYTQSFRARFHQLKTEKEKLEFLKKTHRAAGADFFDHLDGMLTFYNWVIHEETVRNWFLNNGFADYWKACYFETRLASLARKGAIIPSLLVLDPLSREKRAAPNGRRDMIAANAANPKSQGPFSMPGQLVAKVMSTAMAEKPGTHRGWIMSGFPRTLEESLAFYTDAPPTPAEPPKKGKEVEAVNLEELKFKDDFKPDIMVLVNSAKEVCQTRLESQGTGDFIEKEFQTGMDQWNKDIQQIQEIFTKHLAAAEVTISSDQAAEAEREKHEAEVKSAEEEEREAPAAPDEKDLVVLASSTWTWVDTASSSVSQALQDLHPVYNFLPPPNDPLASQQASKAESGEATQEVLAQAGSAEAPNEEKLRQEQRVENVKKEELATYTWMSTEVNTKNGHVSAQPHASPTIPNAMAMLMRLCLITWTLSWPVTGDVSPEKAINKTQLKRQNASADLGKLLENVTMTNVTSTDTQKQLRGSQQLPESSNQTRSTGAWWNGQGGGGGGWGGNQGGGGGWGGNQGGGGGWGGNQGGGGGGRPGRPNNGGGWGGGNNFGWGHGVAGETCCMCSKQRRRKTVLFAGGDFDHRYGSQSAHQHCDAVCELQCVLQNGHKFGCYEEDDLIRMSRRYQGNSNFKIKHEKRYGNIC
eukprot:symbB.v1.2.024083.t1/scaffold2254.1/size86662/2